MITSERLEELIKQGDLIFDKYGNKIVLENTDIYFAISQNRLLKINKMPNFEIDHWELNEIFETKKQAEWHRKTTAERTERFAPPMWEDIKDYYEFVWLDTNFDDYIIKVDKERNKIVVGKMFNEPLFEEPATKKNYIKACEIVRDLFNKGDEKW